MNKKLKENLFFAIEELISKACIIFSYESLSQKLRQLDTQRNSDTKYLNRYLNRFKEQGLIRMINKKGRDYYSLTEKGIKKLNNFRFKNNIKQKWDGLWRVVIFDIPEDKKIVREALRRRLKYFSFFPLQKSVFVFPFDCEKEIDDLAEFFDVSEYLYTLLVKSLGHKEEEVRQFFSSRLR